MAVTRCLLLLLASNRSHAIIFGFDEVHIYSSMYIFQLSRIVLITEILAINNEVYMH